MAVKKTRIMLAAMLAAVVIIASTTHALLSKTPVKNKKGVPGIPLVEAQDEEVLNGSWGTGKAQYGKNVSASVPGPMSYASKDGKVYILDQDNQRVQVVTQKGSYLKPIVLKKKTYQDMVVDDNYIFVLDLWRDLVVDVYSLEGGFVKQLSIKGVDRQTDFITGFQIVKGKALIEISNEYSKAIAEIGKNSVIPINDDRKIAGRLGPKGEQMQAYYDSAQSKVSLQIDEKEIDLKDSKIRSIVDWIVDGDSSYLLLGMGKEGKEGIEDAYFSLIKITDAKAKWQMILPEKAPSDIYRKVAVDNNNVYQLQIKKKGVVLVKWQQKK